MIFDRIEWDDDNLDHATRRASVEEIEQALTNAERAVGSRRHRGAAVSSVTDGGRRLVKACSGDPDLARWCAADNRMG